MKYKNTISGNNIQLNKPYIDSLRLYIPYNKCKILDPKLTSRIQKVFEDDNIPDEQALHSTTAPEPYKINTKCGINSYVSITKIFSKPYVTLLISAKLLKKLYFLGITKHTIKIAYDFFMQQNIFHCTYKTFITSQPTDIDFAFNRYVQSREAFYQVIKELIRQSAENSEYLKHYNKSNNQGLEFSKRKSKFSIHRPHITFYNKEIELKHKSNKFYYNHVEHLPINNLIRCEFNLKNTAHKDFIFKKKILPPFETLYELLNIPEASVHDFMVFSLNQYITKKTYKKRTDLTPADHQLYTAIQYLVHQGYTLGKIHNLLNDSYSVLNKSNQQKAIYRLRKKTETLYNLLLKNDPKMALKTDENTHVQDFISYLIKKQPDVRS
jgi:hypothetical protein